MRTFTPAEAARESGFSLETLRYYEREGILTGVARTPGGHRTFSESDLHTLGMLRCLRDTGMPISLLRAYGQLCQDDSTLPERIALLTAHAEEVDRKLRELAAQRARIAEKVAHYRNELEHANADGRRT